MVCPTEYWPWRAIRPINYNYECAHGDAHEVLGRVPEQEGADAGSQSDTLAFTKSLPWGHIVPGSLILLRRGDAVESTWAECQTGGRVPPNANEGRAGSTAGEEGMGLGGGQGMGGVSQGSVGGVISDPGE